MLAPLTLSPGSRRAELELLPHSGQRGSPWEAQGRAGSHGGRGGTRPEFPGSSCRSLPRSLSRQDAPKAREVGDVGSALPRPPSRHWQAGSSRPFPSWHPSPHMPLFTRSAYPPPHNTPLPPESGRWEKFLRSPRTEPDIQGAHRGQDEPVQHGGWLGGLGQEAQQKRPETKPTEHQAGDDRISRQAFLTPRGNTQHMAGGNNRPSFLPSPAENAPSGEEERGRGRPSLPEGLPE